VAGRSDYILSVVPPEASLAAAESAAPHLGPGKVYLDLTSSSPEEMRAAALRVEASPMEHALATTDPAELAERKQEET
jgi:3-hydroxyisobutyrate dehydrogenase-like beta-hydroxyacid dehydrogenase